MSEISFRNRNLRGIDLSYTNLRGANLRGANLNGSDLSYANLYKADLRSADLSYANLSHVILDGSTLRDADLTGANLDNATLHYTELYKANLYNAKLKNADLRASDLSYAINIPYIPMICPEIGSFIGYKKAAGDKIIKLQILEDSRRSSATGRKCRCDKALVLSITNLDGTNSNMPFICSDHDGDFIYKVGEIVEEPAFDENRWKECTKGIHFFITRQEAVNYFAVITNVKTIK